MPQTKATAPAQPAPGLDARVGVVIRTRDRPLFVPRALRSVLAQDYPGWRVVLVNDGGDAAQLDAAIGAARLSAPFEDGRMMRLDLDQSIGRSEAFNRGARALQTEFVCCLDDDDSWDPAFLSALLELYDRTLPNVPDLGGVAALVTAVREDILPRNGVPSIVRLGEDSLPASFGRTDFFLNPIAYATYRHDLYPVQWMLDREAVLAEGGFPSAFSVMEDRAFLTRFLQRRRIAILDRKLAYHHRRAQRTGDTAQSAGMNTLDNPSYDWRFFSDLARIEANAPQEKTALDAAMAGDMIRAAAATVVKELNAETSALWHKINGEAQTMRARIESLEARLGAVDPLQEIATPAARRIWALWPNVGEQDIGYPLSATTPFLSRFSLSMAHDQPGLYLHASPAQRRMVVQIPQTRDFAALEFALDGLAEPDGGLLCEAIFSSPAGYLFQTALSVWRRDRLGRKSHAFEQAHVHAIPPGGSVAVARTFAVADLAGADRPKFAIILPRQALDFRLTCHDLVVSHP